jgi:hypothetical protein
MFLSQPPKMEREAKEQVITQVEDPLPQFVVGEVVLISNLNSNQHLNGTVGVVYAHDVASGRFVVKTDDPIINDGNNSKITTTTSTDTADTMFRLKPSNLTRAKLCSNDLIYLKGQLKVVDVEDVYCCRIGVCLSVCLSCLVAFLPISKNFIFILFCAVLCASKVSLCLSSVFPHI